MSSQDLLKYASGDELAQFQNIVLRSHTINDEDKVTILEAISDELRIRQTEGLDRKASRFWKRHGEKVGLVALGALFGVGLDGFGD